MVLNPNWGHVRPRVPPRSMFFWSCQVMTARSLLNGWTPPLWGGMRSVLNAKKSPWGSHTRSRTYFQLFHDCLEVTPLTHHGYKYPGRTGPLLQPPAPVPSWEDHNSTCVCVCVRGCVWGGDPSSPSCHHSRGEVSLRETASAKTPSDLQPVNRHLSPIRRKPSVVIKKPLSCCCFLSPSSCKMQQGSRLLSVDAWRMTSTLAASRTSGRGSVQLCKLDS